MGAAGFAARRGARSGDRLRARGTHSSNPPKRQCPAASPRVQRHLDRCRARADRYRRHDSGCPAEWVGDRLDRPRGDGAPHCRSRHAHRVERRSRPPDCRVQRIVSECARSRRLERCRNAGNPGNGRCRHARVRGPRVVRAEPPELGRRAPSAHHEDGRRHVAPRCARGRSGSCASTAWKTKP